METPSGLTFFLSRHPPRDSCTEHRVTVLNAPYLYMKIEPGREPFGSVDRGSRRVHTICCGCTRTCYGCPDRPPKKHGYAYRTATSQHLDANPDRMPCIGGQSKPCRGVIGSEARVEMARFSQQILLKRDRARAREREKRKIERSNRLAKAFSELRRAKRRHCGQHNRLV